MPYLNKAKHYHESYMKRKDKKNLQTIKNCRRNNQQ